jgi:hypothetical protein
MYDKNQLENGIVAACTSAAEQAGLSGLQRARFVVAATESILTVISTLPEIAPATSVRAPRKPRGPNKPKPVAAAVVPPAPVPPAPVPPAPAAAAPALPFGS